MDIILRPNLSLRLILISVLFTSTIKCTGQTIPSLGIVGLPSNDSLYYAAGFKLVGTTVASLISPSLGEEQFDNNLKLIRSMQCKIYMCNVLFPGDLKIAGPDVNEEKVLDYLTTVCVRAKKAEIKNLILGSSGARRLPDQYDAQKARHEFILLSRKMADVAQKYDVTIILESLNRTETNFINTLHDAADIVRTVNHKAFRLNADLYHMMKENESPEEIVKAGDLIVYCEIAEKEKRTLPGMAKDDFTPFLKALKKINYQGPIVIEGNSPNLSEDAPNAYEYLSEQLEEVFKGD
jgi:sugar phosphate isomerase/epimerase